MRRTIRLILGALALSTSGTGFAGERALKAPAGFEVSLYADDKLAHDIFSLTLDGQGRVVVSGPGYIKALVDENGDGRADRASLLSTLPKSGAFGLCFVGNDLLYTGDNGLWRLRNADGHPPTGPGELLATLGSAEHGSHAIVHGPDGSIYVICGNDSKVLPEHVTSKHSLIASPLAGCVLKFSADGKVCACVADGLRNACGLAFDERGSLFTVDSDGERDQYLPWYTPTRLFELEPGAHHGWVNQGWQSSWNRPASWYDSVRPLSLRCRGSPTGVAVYRHTAFPERYRGGVFSGCWTLGRVYYFPLAREGAGYRAEKEIFLESLGGSGFAPTDMAVGPRGELYIATGGRGTQGSVYVVRPTGAAASAPPNGPTDALTEVLAAPEPLAAWSRAKWLPEAKKLEAAAFRTALGEASRPQAERLRAVEILAELFGGCTAADVERALAAGDAEVAARAARSYLSGEHEVDVAMLLKLVGHDEVRVAAAAWEHLQGLPAPALEWTAEEWQRAARHFSNARVLAACARAINRSPQVQDKLPATLALTAAFREPCGNDLSNLVDKFVATESRTEKLFYVRWMLRALGDVNTVDAQPAVFVGYVPKAPSRVKLEVEQRIRLAGAFPTANAELNHELARLLAVLEVESEELVEHVAAVPTEQASVPNDLHYLIVLARLPGMRTEAATKATAAALARLHGKMDRGELYPSRNWPDRVGELLEELCEHDKHLAEALVDDGRFLLPAQAIFAQRMPAELQAAAAEKLLAAAKENAETRWTPELVKLVAALPAEKALPALRAQWSDFTLRDAILLALAIEPETEDRARFFTGLNSAEPKVVQECAIALSYCEGEAAADDFAAVLGALRQYCQAPKYTGLRQHLEFLLQSWSNEEIEIDDNGQGDLLVRYKPWFDWFAKIYPDAAAKLAAEGTVDLAEWSTRLEKVAWEEGAAERGRLVFEQRNCFKCHAGASRFGPDLVGAAGRFSRNDLFTAILDPNKDVSPLFRTTQVVTGAGKVTVGVIVYESPESTLVQTGPDETVRVAGEEIVAMRPSRQSLMPQGMLNGASDRELADLYAYLKSLGKKE